MPSDPPSGGSRPPPPIVNDADEDWQVLDTDSDSVGRSDDCETVSSTSASTENAELPRQVTMVEAALESGGDIPSYLSDSSDSDELPSQVPARPKVAFSETPRVVQAAPSTAPAQGITNTSGHEPLPCFVDYIRASTEEMNGRRANVPSVQAGPSAALAQGTTNTPGDQPAPSIFDHFRASHEAMNGRRANFPSVQAGPSTAPAQRITNSSGDKPSSPDCLRAAPSRQELKIDKVLPNEGPKGGDIEVTILLSGNSCRNLAVWFGDTPAPMTTFWNFGKLVCTLPPSTYTGPVPVTLQLSLGETIVSLAAPPAPTFTYRDDSNDTVHPATRKTFEEAVRSGDEGQDRHNGIRPSCTFGSWVPAAQSTTAPLPPGTFPDAHVRDTPSSGFSEIERSFFGINQHDRLIPTYGPQATYRTLYSIPANAGVFQLERRRERLERERQRLEHDRLERERINRERLDRERQRLECERLDCERQGLDLEREHLDLERQRRRNNSDNSITNPSPRPDDAPAPEPQTASGDSRRDRLAAQTAQAGAAQAALRQHLDQERQRHRNNAGNCTTKPPRRPDDAWAPEPQAAPDDIRRDTPAAQTARAIQVNKQGLPAPRAPYLTSANTDPNGTLEANEEAHRDQERRLEAIRNSIREFQDEADDSGYVQWGRNFGYEGALRQLQTLLRSELAAVNRADDEIATFVRREWMPWFEGSPRDRVRTQPVFDSLLARRPRREQRQLQQEQEPQQNFDSFQARHPLREDRQPQQEQQPRDGLQTTLEALDDVIQRDVIRPVGELLVNLGVLPMRWTEVADVVTGFVLVMALSQLVARFVIGAGLLQLPMERPAVLFSGLLIPIVISGFVGMAFEFLPTRTRRTDGGNDHALPEQQQRQQQQRGRQERESKE